MKDFLALTTQENANHSFKMEDKLNHIPKQNAFLVPEGYFDALLQRIHLRLQQSSQQQVPEEMPLEGYSTIHDLAKNSVFTTPPDYFENLYNRLLIQLQNQSQAVPVTFEALENFEAGLTQKELYEAPENYFENLSEQILSKILYSEKQKPAPLDFSALEEGELGILASLPKENVFQLPENYFEQFSVTPVVPVETTVPKTDEKEAKVIRLIPSWARYAASVAAAVLVLLGGYWFYPKNVTRADDCTELLCNLSDEEILQYLETQDVRFNGAQAAAPATSPLDHGGLDQTDLSEDELLNAAESIE